MVTRMDQEIGKLLDMLRDFGLDENTIVVFTSDNGPLYDRLGGTDTDFFDSAAGLRGRKGNFYEAGYRVPCIVRWTGHIRPGTMSDRVTGFEDWFPTLFELIGATDLVPKGIDGISFAPTLLGGTQKPKPFLYRESSGYTGHQVVRVGNWKAIRRNLNPSLNATNQQPGEIELYDLAADPRETTSVADANADMVARLKKIMQEQHVPSTTLALRAIDGK